MNTWRLMASLAGLAFCSSAMAATIVFTDDFNRADSSTLGNNWAESVSAGDGDARIASNRLELTNDGSGAANASGRVWAYQDMSLYTTYNPAITNAGGVITWAFNMRQIRADPSGFNGGLYGVAFVLGGTNNDFLDGNGYAVVLGQSGGTDPVRLVRYTGGLDLDSNLTNVISSGGDFADEFLNLKVIFNPATDAWSLYLTSGGSFSDPLLVNTQVGVTTVDATYTGSNLRYMGGLWNYATAANQTALFDNVTVLIPEPGTLVLLLAGATIASPRGRRRLSRQ